MPLHAHSQEKLHFITHSSPVTQWIACYSKPL